jgi:hypothetical protein
VINIIKTAKRGTKNPKGIPSPKLHNNIEAGINKYIGARQETIKISLTDKLSKDFRGFHCVNGDTYYNPQYYQIIKPSDTVEQELKQLTNIDRLKKKLITYFNNLSRLRYLSGDNKILKERSISKAKKTIQKYLSSLREDPNFNLTKSENAIYLAYSGAYVTARKVVVL